MLWKNKSTFLLISNVILTAILLSAIWFLYQKINTASAIVLDADQKIASLEKKQSELTGALSDIKAAENNLASINSIYLNDDTFVNLVKLLENLASESGNGFKAESASLPTIGKASASIIFTVEGRFANIFNFIALLDSIPYAGFVSDLSIGPKTEGAKNSGILAARIQYLIFSFNSK